MKIERLYSDYQEERLYSTGNDELDELLERAFCDGYEYAQREYGAVDKYIMDASYKFIKNTNTNNGKKVAKVANRFSKRFPGNSKEALNKAGMRAGKKNQDKAAKVGEAFINGFGQKPSKQLSRDLVNNLTPNLKGKTRGYLGQREIGMI